MSDKAKYEASRDQESYASLNKMWHGSTESDGHPRTEKTPKKTRSTRAMLWSLRDGTRILASMATCIALLPTVVDAAQVGVPAICGLQPMVHKNQRIEHGARNLCTKCMEQFNWESDLMRLKLCGIATTFKASLLGGKKKTKYSERTFTFKELHGEKIIEYSVEGGLEADGYIKSVEHVKCEKQGDNGNMYQYSLTAECVSKNGTKAPGIGLINFHINFLGGQPAPVTHEDLVTRLAYEFNCVLASRTRSIFSNKMKTIKQLKRDEARKIKKQVAGVLGDIVNKVEARDRKNEEAKYAQQDKEQEQMLAKAGIIAKTITHRSGQDYFDDTEAIRRRLVSPIQILDKRIRSSKKSHN